VYPTVSATELRNVLHESLPLEPQDPSAVLDQFARLATFGRNNGHPRMFGYVQSAPSFAGVIGDFLASALNQNVTSWRSAPSATTVELQVIDWLKALVGFDPAAAGVLLSGGSAANFAALAVALRASTTVDLNERGVAALPGVPRIYASSRVHMSIPKAAALLGLGRAAVSLVPVDEGGRMNVHALESQIASDAAAGAHQICVVANAGEVNTGAIDPLDAVADLCQSRRLWLHVDGSYGGFAVAAPRAMATLAGLARADSLALDPHKWLFAPLDVGCLLVRNPSHLRRAFAHGASYIDVVADRDMSEFAFWDVSPELSRRFRALKIWFALKCHGTRALSAAIDDNIALAQQLGALIDGSEDFELLAPVSLSIVCFRYVPARLRDRAAHEPSTREHALNDFNRRLMVHVQRQGDSYLSNAMLDERFALRACIANYRTQSTDVPILLDDIRRAATQLPDSAS
jgi:aromatic-L-amino-acid decarboxylase